MVNFSKWFAFDWCQRWQRWLFNMCGYWYDEFLVWLQTNIVEHLCEWWSARLQVPGFIKNRMMRRFYLSGLDINVTDVFISCWISYKDAIETMAIQLGVLLTHLFDTNTRAKHLKCMKIWFETMSCFKWSHEKSYVHSAVLEIYCVNQGKGPENGRQAWTIV